MYFFAGDKNPVSTYPARHTRNIPRETLANRTTPLTQDRVAAVKIKDLVPSFRVASVGRFVIASDAQHSPDAMKRIVAQLDRYLDFLARTYQVALPDRFVTIYLVPTLDELHNLADRIHGLDVSRATIGYTYRDDLSVVAVITGEQIGTLFHKFFHLAVRNNFGDVPQWLDEGIASLYEVSAFYGDAVLGEPNWRGKVLRQFWDIRPTLAEVIVSEWFPFDVVKFRDDEGGFSESSQKVAAQMAAGRYFILYCKSSACCLISISSSGSVMSIRPVTTRRETPSSSLNKRWASPSQQPKSTLTRGFPSSNGMGLNEICVRAKSSRRNCRSATDYGWCNCNGVHRRLCSSNTMGMNTAIAQMQTEFHQTSLQRSARAKAMTGASESLARRGPLNGSRTRLSRQSNRSLLAPPIPAGKQFGASTGLEFSE
jgi:hypothetical protein